MKCRFVKPNPVSANAVNDRVFEGISQHSKPSANLSARRCYASEVKQLRTVPSFFVAMCLKSFFNELCSALAAAQRRFVPLPESSSVSESKSENASQKPHYAFLSVIALFHLSRGKPIALLFRRFEYKRRRCLSPFPLHFCAVSFGCVLVTCACGTKVISKITLALRLGLFKAES